MTACQPGAVRAVCSRRHARGLTLIELIMFIVIVSVGVAGILGVMNLTNKSSADPVIHKQALAIAEAYLEEVLAMPFTYCDPDDANAATAEAAVLVPPPANPTLRCATNIEVLGAENMGGLETRGGTPPFDNVNDYSALTTAAPSTVDNPGTPIAGLDGYTVTVAIVTAALGSGGTVVAATDANGAPLSLRVTVTVTGPAGTTVRLDGYRTRYAPNALP